MTQFRKDLNRLLKRKAETASTDTLKEYMDWYLNRRSA